MNKNLGNFISIGLDLELFYNLTVSEYEFSLQGFYSAKTEKHLLAKGFIKFDYLYADNDKIHEYKCELFKCRIILMPKTK